MSPTVSDVSAWNPDALKLTSEGIRGLAAQLDDRMRELVAGQDSLRESWDGIAADSATKRIGHENSTASLVAHALQQLAREFESGAAVIGSARDHVISTVNGIRQRGFAVREDGTVDASTLTVWLVMAPAETRDAARLRLEREAAELSLALLEALRQAESAASDVSARVRESLSEVTSAGRDAVPGHIAESQDGEFSWAPDVPATVAASSIGVMVDATREGLIGAAKASGDDVARLIGRGMGPFGAALGAVPAIANDINGGMDATKAVTTEAAGAGIGFAFGTWFGGMASSAVAGSAAGSAVPGLGTAVGLVVGAIIGGGAAYGGAKGLQRIWD